MTGSSTRGPGGAAGDPVAASGGAAGPRVTVELAASSPLAQQTSSTAPAATAIKVRRCRLAPRFNHACFSASGYNMVNHFQHCGQCKLALLHDGGGNSGGDTLRQRLEFAANGGGGGGRGAAGAGGGRGPHDHHSHLLADRTGQGGSHAASAAAAAAAAANAAVNVGVNASANFNANAYATASACNAASANANANANAYGRVLHSSTFQINGRHYFRGMLRYVGWLH